MKTAYPSDNLLIPGAKLRHFKGEMYEVKGIAIDSTNNSLSSGLRALIYFRCNNPEVLYVRSLSEVRDLVANAWNNTVGQNFRFEVVIEDDGTNN